MAIKTIGIGGDYSSPGAWKASLPATLTEPETARILDDLSSLNDVQKTFDINVLTSASNFITIETYDAVSSELRAQDFKAGNGDIPVIEYGRGGSYGFITRREGCHHLVVRNLTVNYTATSTNLVSDFRTTNPSDNFTRIYNNYWFRSGISYGTILVDSGTNGEIYNNVLVTGNINGILTNASDVDVYNNTLVATFSDAEIARSGIRYGNGAVERNAVFHYGSTGGNRCYLSNSTVFNENASDDTSGSIGFRSLSLLDQYVDPENHDWSFKSGNSLEGAASGGKNIGAFLESAIAAPEEYSGGFSLQSGSNIVLAGEKVAKSEFALLADADAVVIGKKHASGVISSTGSSSVSNNGIKQGFGELHTSSSSSVSTNGAKNSSGALSSTSLSSVSVAGFKQAFGSFTSNVVATVTVSGSAATIISRSGGFSLQSGASIVLAGEKLAKGKVVSNCSSVISVDGFKQAFGGFTSNVVATVTVSGSAATIISRSGGFSLQSGSSIVLAGKKSSSSAISLTSAASISVSGVKSGFSALVVPSVSSVLGSGVKYSSGVFELVSNADVSLVGFNKTYTPVVRKIVIEGHIVNGFVLPCDVNNKITIKGVF
ncbi:hypothetical protein Q4489_04320 [Thalassotalea sp. 1_MG-2023]|uniref:hypothetical protein n=1 Tax=Thalassotalea sp. 1_MG-2023 TaxID=3062680 RepID=UPI0026E2C613|nr:hypothetical protein [Thalassotalea sp. 1_MG-2023]MDO6426222.1 hypothetical protein [Thalassotalea sp. 1_MG-2023]